MPINKVATDIVMMQKDIKELEELVGVIKTRMQNMRNEVGELNTMWEGSTKIEFNNQFDEDYNTLEQAMVCISRMIDNMKLVEREYAKCEESVSDIIKDVNI